MATKSKKAKKLDDIQEVVCSIEETKEMIKHQFRQQILLGPKYSGLMYFIVAEPGVGKTQLQAQIVKEMSKEILEEMKAEGVFNPVDYEYFRKEQKGEGRLEMLNLSAKDSQDFSGLPLIDSKTRMMTFAHPDNLPTEGYGIICYDEANRVFDLDMKSTLLSLWMDRGVNGHYLGSGYIQVACGNPFEDERFETEKADKALAERYRIIKMIPKINEVISFLEKKYKTHFLLDFLKENKDFCNLVGDFENSFSPRLIDKGMEITFSMKDKPEDKLTLVKTILATYFGHSYATKIVNYLKNNKEITFEKVVENPELAEKIKKTDMPLMTKLSTEMFNKWAETFTNNAKLSEEENTAMVLVVDKLNAESQSLIMNNIASHEKHNELFDFILESNRDFLKVLHRVTNIF